MEIQAAIVGVVAAALIAAIVYYYKTTILCDVQSLKASAKIENGGLVFGKGTYPSIDIVLENITLENIGFRDVSDADFYLDGVGDEFYLSRISTKSISKSTVSVSKEGDGIKISIKHFPRNEIIQISISHSTDRSIWREVKGQGEKFKTQEKKERENIIKGALWVVKMITFGVLFGAAVNYLKLLVIK